MSLRSNRHSLRTFIPSLMSAGSYWEACKSARVGAVRRNTPAPGGRQYASPLVNRQTMATTHSGSQRPAAARMRVPPRTKLCDMLGITDLELKVIFK